MKKNYCTKKVNDLQARAENNAHNRNILLKLQRARKKIMLTKTKGVILRSSEMACRRRTQQKVFLQLRKTTS